LHYSSSSCATLFYQRFLRLLVSRDTVSDPKIQSTRPEMGLENPVQRDQQAKMNSEKATLSELLIRCSLD
jgi:hypothetical protein